MNHKFNQLIIGISGVCEECKQYVESKKTLTIREIDWFRGSGSKTLREFKLELAFNDLDIHVCKSIGEGKEK